MSGYNVQRDYTKDYQDKPARRQVEYQHTQNVDTTGSFNIWYSKWSGDGGRGKKGIEKAEHRCILERDAGRTKAGKNTVFCIHFAHGQCSKGPACTFLHRIPLDGDRFETTLDCFGRDKHRVDRDDMGGIGSFERQNTTLYIGHVDINDNMESIVRRHFSEWGEIEHINILPSKGVAFVRYVRVANAEFAKEAMYGQSLDHGEVLNVRWATEDPNPTVIRENKRKADDIVTSTILSKLPDVGSQGTAEEYERLVKQQKVGADETAMTANGFYNIDPEAASAAAAYYQYYASYGYYPQADGTWAYIPPTTTTAVSTTNGNGVPPPPGVNPSSSVQTKAGSQTPAPVPQSIAAPTPQPVAEITSASSAYAVVRPKSAAATVQKVSDSKKENKAPVSSASKAVVDYGSSDDEDD